MRHLSLKTPKLTLLCAIVFVSGCLSTSHRVVYVPAGDPVRLAEPVKCHVWVPDSTGKQVKSDNTVTLPEGWWALPMPEKK